MTPNIESNNEEVLDRICDVYGFTQKIQLARHFNIAASSLQNRYSRGAISYDFIVYCSLETGANVRWILTGEGEKLSGKEPLQANSDEQISIKKFTLSEGKLANDGALSIDRKLFSKPIAHPQCVASDGKIYMLEIEASLSDGSWLIDIEGDISIRELTKLPGRKLHVAGGKIPFECGIDDIKVLGRVVGIYSEIS
ncbi:phage repressor protein CI [Dickeya dadantii]|uniref:phage repressor protein CI n=1 Tax=Dickeya dadantii TaxID=204038 RepID=UPI0035A87F52